MHHFSGDLFSNYNPLYASYGFQGFHRIALLQQVHTAKNQRSDQLSGWCE